MKLLRRQGRATEKVLEQAASLEEAGRSLEALDLLLETNRRDASPEIETRIVQIRNRAFDELGEPGSDYAAPEGAEFGAAAEEDGLPSLDASQLSAGAIRSAFLSHGSLLVRGLCPADAVDTLRTGIDRAFEQRDASAAGAPHSETSHWFNPFVPDRRFEGAVLLGRSFVGGGSGIWTADSPRMLFELLETFDTLGVREVVGEYLGERPAISVNKGTLRRVAPTGGTEWWHQDGAFLGEGIRSLNIWLSLTASGKDAPGMDVVAKRLDHIVKPGSGGADFDWSLGDDAVREVAGDTIRRPLFEAGDALLFDHLHLHRTGTDPGMTKTRYAIETWFFAPSAYPDPHEQVPLVY